MSRITVTTKLNEEEYERLNLVAEFLGETKNGFLKRVVMEELNGGQDELSSLSTKTGISKSALVKNLGYLIDTGKIHIENGRMSWKPESVNEYSSVDDAIENMGISEGEKEKLRRRIIEGLESMTEDVESGAGL